MDDPFLSDPDGTRGDRGLARVFLLALALMVVLTIIIFDSGLWPALGRALLLALNG